MNVAWPLTVYYDASCPLCRTEIETLKARDGCDRLRLVDCSPPSFGSPGDGVTRDDLMSRIHARDSRGRWLRGIDVFAAAYAAAGMRRVAALYASPLLRPLLDRAYPWVADHRMLLSRLGLSRVFRLVPGRHACAACDKIPPP